MDSRRYGSRLPRGLGRWLFAMALVGAAQAGLASSDYAAAWGPSVGTKAPLLAANDQDGTRQTLQTLAGPEGLLVVFNRSVDW